MKSKHISSEQILLYVLDELSFEKKNKVESHLDTCDRCQNLVRKEKALFQLVGKQSQWQPRESLLQECRIRFTHRLKEETSFHTQKKFWAAFLHVLDFQIPVRKLTSATVLFLLGLVLGRSIPWSKHNEDLSSSRAIQALQSASPISNFQVMPSTDEPNQVRIRFQTVQENFLEGNLQNPDIQFALAYALLKDPQDNIRLRSIQLLQGSSEDQMVQETLIRAIENDENPAVRLIAIKALKNLPVNESIKNILITTFLRDPNAGVRIEAAKGLNQLEDSKIRSILKKRAKEDDYIRALISKTEEKNPVSLSREK